MIRKRWLVAGAIFVVLTLTAGTCGNDPKDTQSRSQHVTQDYQARFEQARPYPLAVMRDSLERKQLTERLVRFNDPQKIGYVTLLTFTGEVIGTFTIQGKISSTESQLTTANQISRYCRDNSNCSDYQVVESPGDDGSYGPNEGGVFFFTTSGVMVQIPAGVSYIYSDAPIKIDSVTHEVSVQGAPSNTGGTGIGG